ncbi:P-loop containing nucleoside triphosphate hydrolase protein [Armillaria gallica]|uniref:P-loop containing nucleoside triphosphate hydrolase protein n=1 Tax=Armillaria gallica TaxID=47427 RepID=A0A2H3CEK9_ARMGA|nr:P-loop containing nucleoside triphosphate hydrolase protein [Armillaria gallica]
MGRNPQPARALCAIIFACYPHVFDDPVWQAQYEFFGFDTNNIKHVRNSDLASIREFLKHLKNLTLEKAIIAVNGADDEDADAYSNGRLAYFTWWSKCGLLAKLKVVHENAMRASGVNIKAMYRMHKARGVNQFLAASNLRHKEPELAEALFGTAHEDDESGGIHIEFQELVQFLTGEYIERFRKSYKNASNAKTIAKKQLDAAWKAIAAGHGIITAKAGDKISKALVKYERFLGWEATPEEMEEVGEFERRKGEFEQALSKSEANAEELKKQKRTTQYILGRTAPSRMNVVATEEEIEALRIEFLDEMKHIASIREEEETHRHDGETNPGRRPGLVEFDEWESIGDMGVEAWAKKTEEALKELLRWPEGRPVEFNPFINETLVDLWANPEYAKKIPPEGDVDNKPTTLFWHQHVGIVALINMIWTAQEQPNGVEGAILADEVGLGKSAQIMGLLAFIMAARRAQLAGKEPPPVIANLPFFCGRKEILNAPHLLIVPNTLLGQWVSELKRWFRPHTVDILVVPTMERGWEDWYKTKLDASKQDPCNIVIVGTHSNISQLGHKNLRVTKSKKIPAGELRPEKPNSFGYLPLWKREFCSATVDEAHNFRTNNVSFHSLQHIMNVAWVKLLVTATPLYQSPCDLINLGRLARISRFLGSKADADEQAAKREIARLRREVLKDNPDALIDYNNRALHGDNTKNPFEAVYARTNQWVRDIQAAFSGRVIRRSGESIVYTDPPQDPPKKLMNDLPPYELIEVGVTLNEAEQEEMDKQVTNWTKSAKRTGAVDVADSGAFLLNYRLALAYPESLRRKDTEEPKSARYAPFKNMEEWDAYRGAKLQAAVDICLHMLSGDDRPPPVVDPDTAHVIFPELPPLPDGETRTFKRKIIIFHEFPMMDEMVKSVFALFGIRVEAVNGKMKLDARQKIIDEFIHGDDIRVLLLSQVGVSGLNLMRATVVIILTIGWSGVEQGQMIGRAHRNGQREIVFVFRIIAQNTIDVLMAQRAGAKADQLEKFFTKKESNNVMNRKAYEFLYNCAAPGEHLPDEDDEDSEEDEDSDADDGKQLSREKKGKSKAKAITAPKAKGKKPTASKKRTATDAAEAAGEEDATETPAPKKSKRVYGRKQGKDTSAADGADPDAEVAGSSKRKRKEPVAQKGGKGSRNLKKNAKSKEIVEIESEDEVDDPEDGGSKEDPRPRKRARRESDAATSLPDDEEESRDGARKTRSGGVLKGMKGKVDSTSKDRRPKPRPVANPKSTAAPTTSSSSQPTTTPTPPVPPQPTPTPTPPAPPQPPASTAPSVPSQPTTAPTTSVPPSSTPRSPTARPATPVAPVPNIAGPSTSTPTATTQSTETPVVQQSSMEPLAGSGNAPLLLSAAAVGPVLPHIATMGPDILSGSTTSGSQSWSEGLDELLSVASVAATQGSAAGSDAAMLFDDPIDTFEDDVDIIPKSPIVEPSDADDESAASGNAGSSQQQDDMNVVPRRDFFLGKRGERNRNKHDSKDRKSLMNRRDDVGTSTSNQRGRPKGHILGQKTDSIPQAAKYKRHSDGFVAVDMSSAVKSAYTGYQVKKR